MNYKNCKHYNEVVRVLSENLSLDDVNFKLEETEGCVCERVEDSVCELWCTLAFAHDMAPQLGIEHAEQTIANLDNRMKEIVTRLVSSAGNELESVEISETNIKYNNQIILDKLIESCLKFDADLFLPYLQSEIVSVDMPNKTNFYEFFEYMLVTAKDNSIEPMHFKIEIPHWEKEENVKHFNLYDSVHIHSRLSIRVKELANEIFLDISPF